MAERNLGRIGTTDMENNVSNYSVSAQTLDSPMDNQETTWVNPDWATFLGYYKSIPELKKAIDSFVIWTVGKGFVAEDASTQVMLENCTGWGEDTFQSIMENMIIVKKISGDSFAEIIRNEKGNLINLKPLSPASMKIVLNKQGLITRYEQIDKKSGKSVLTFKPEDILHLSNDRIGDEIHGISVVEACKWVIDARNEAMSDWRRILHRNLAGVRIIEVDEDDTTKLALLKKAWEDAINKGEVLILPKGIASPKDIPPPTNPENWIRYLEGFFYQAVGIPRVIASSDNYTEANGKMGYLTFEPIYVREQTLLEGDLWNQLGIKVKFNRPASLGGTVQEDEAKNTGQLAVQPNELQATARRTE